jgi:hypothetical protein
MLRIGPPPRKPVEDRLLGIIEADARVWLGSLAPCSGPTVVAARQRP